MTILQQALEGVSSVVILGHVHPDGDCVGSCLGLYNYLEEQYPEIQVKLFLEPLTNKFSYLKNFDAICHEVTDEKFGLCITSDASDRERLGGFVSYLDTAGKSLCIDHHVTNRGFAQMNHVLANASSSSEVIYGLLDPDQVSKDVAECLYTGIIHDTGVFKYSCTSPRTMEVAGRLMSTGIDCGKIIDETYYRKTYVQNQILGRALLESVVFSHGLCIFSVVRAKDMDFYGVTYKDLDGIVEQLRLTDGVECAIFMYETGTHDYKVSLRSKNFVDVSKIASYFGGGGHVRAAGCNMSGSIYDVVNNLSNHIGMQLKQAEDICTTEL